MKEYIISVILILVLVAGCSTEKPAVVITNFEECAAAGNPVMESYPRQCRAQDGTTFTEIIGEPQPKITIEEATQIAEESECAEMGTLTEINFYNSNSKTWWIDIEMNAENKKEGCNPACVVFEDTKAVEINWRCTGLIQK